MMLDHRLEIREKYPIQFNTTGIDQLADEIQLDTKDRWWRWPDDEKHNKEERLGCAIAYVPQSVSHAIFVKLMQQDYGKKTRRIIHQVKTQCAEYAAIVRKEYDNATPPSHYGRWWHYRLLHPTHKHKKETEKPDQQLTHQNIQVGDEVSIIYGYPNRTIATVIATSTSHITVKRRRAKQAVRSYPWEIAQPRLRRYDSQSSSSSEQNNEE